VKGGTQLKYEGKAWIFGHDVDTDTIIPARYLTTWDVSLLAPHCMEDVDSGFAREVEPGDVIVAGRNFGCGSSREHAPAVIKALGISAIIAQSFARIFYRNGFNIGLPLVECKEAFERVKRGDRLSLDLEKGEIKNVTRDESYFFNPIPPFMRDLLREGGLVPLLKKGGWRVSSL
jgi:3-isopropylmalate dehydratase small subunit